MEQEWLESVAKGTNGKRPWLCPHSRHGQSSDHIPQTTLPNLCPPVGLPTARTCVFVKELPSDCRTHFARRHWGPEAPGINTQHPCLPGAQKKIHWLPCPWPGGFWDVHLLHFPRLPEGLSSLTHCGSWLNNHLLLDVFPSWITFPTCFSTMWVEIVWSFGGSLFQTIPAFIFADVFHGLRM